MTGFFDVTALCIGLGAPASSTVRGGWLCDSQALRESPNYADNVHALLNQLTGQVCALMKKLICNNRDTSETDQINSLRRVSIDAVLHYLTDRLVHFNFRHCTFNREVA